MNLKKLILSFFIVNAISLPALAEKKISVLPFDVLTQKEDMKQFGIGTMDTLTNALSNVPEFIMIDRGQLNAVLKEQAFQKSGFSDKSDSTEIGKLIGADILVLGSIQAFDNEYRINAHFTEVKTGKILKTVLVTGNNIFKLQDQLASELIKNQEVKISTQQQEAIKNITQATENSEAYNYYIKGRTAYLLNTIEDYKKAIEYFNKALEIDKNYSLAFSAKSEAQAHLYNEQLLSGIIYKDLITEAESNAKIALIQNKNLAESHRALSTIYITKADYISAKNEAEETLKYNPNDAEAYLNLWITDSYINKKSFDPKNILLTKSLELNPNLIHSHTFLSLSYLKVQDIENGIKEAKKIIEINPNNMYGHYMLGNYYLGQGKSEEALKELNKSLELNPNNSIALSGLGNYYFSQGKFDEAIDKLKESIKISSINPGSYFTLGMVYYTKGLYNEAYEQLEMATKLLPSYDEFAHVHNIKGLIFKKQGKLSEAIVEFKRAIQLNFEQKIQDDTPHYNLGLVYQQQNNFEQAINEFKQVKKSYVDENKIKEHLTNSYLGLGVNLYQQGKNLDVINVYKQANELNHDNADIHVNLGVAYYNNKQPDKAIEEYQQAIKLNPNHANAHYNLGIIYQSQNNNEMAKIEYQKSCDLGMKSACQ